MKYKTGDKAPVTGNYRFAGFVDSRVNCKPTTNERIIPMKRGDTFPPVRSCDAAAWWQRA